MLFNELGWFNDDVAIVGTTEIPLYLLKLEDGFALIEGGITGMAPRVIEQLEALTGDLARIHHWLITHSHYDHCALLTHVLPKLPNAKVWASEASKKAFSKDKARQVVKKLNDDIAATWWPDRSEAHPLEQTAISLGDVDVTVVADDEVIELDGTHQLQALATPGHSRCLLTFYDPDRQWAWVSDTLGELIEPGAWCPLSFDDLAQYRASIRRVRDLNANTLFLAHNGTLTEAEARAAPSDALSGFEAFREDAFTGLEAPEATPKTVADQFSRRFRHVSERFVSETLHRQSMLRIVTLLIEEAEEDNG